VWNITAALGGQPSFGRGNCPLDLCYLPAGIVVKLAPFNEDVLQHSVFLERPEGSEEPKGKGFEPERVYVDRGRQAPDADGDRLRDGRRLLAERGRRHAQG
jgi:hypothetical protein